MRYTVAGLTFSLWVALAMPSSSKEEPLSAEGVVVAIQRGEGDLRLVDPNSVGDLAEIYMMRVDRWSQPQKQKYIIVEYIHRTDLIRYEQFDKTRWRFEVHQASAAETKDCLSWMARGPSFLPTAFGAKDELPNPTELSCFLMTKRPVPVRQGKAASTVDPKDGSLHLEIPVAATTKPKQ